VIVVAGLYAMSTSTQQELGGVKLGDTSATTSTSPRYEDAIAETWTKWAPERVVTADRN